MFEANARAHPQVSASSSSSAPVPPPQTAQQYPKEKAPRPPSPPPPQQEEPAVRPLRIVKRSQAAAYKKAVEAGSSNDPPSGPPSSTDGGASLSRSFSVLSVGRRTPPPMFETVGPNYDGPEYEEVVMSYVPGNSRPSSPVSVLSTDSYRPPLPPPPQSAGSRPDAVIHPPPPPPVQYQPPQRPITTQAQRPRPQYPQTRRRVGFDPMSAYKTKPVFTPGLEPTPERVDPASFYKWVESIHPVYSTHCSLIPLQFRRLSPPLNRSPAVNNHSNLPEQRSASTVNILLFAAAYFIPCTYSVFFLVAENYNTPALTTP